MRPDALAAGERRLLDLLIASRGSVEVADIGEALGVPVLAWWQGGRPAAATCGAAAVAEGLRAVLLNRQAVMTGESAYAPARWARLGAPVAGDGSAELPVPAGPERMVGALRSRGARPLVVPLDHDPAVHEVLPFVVRVIIADGPGEGPAGVGRQAEARGDA